MSEFLQKLYFFVLNPSGLCLLYRSSQVWTNPTWSSSALSWPFGSLCPWLINRDGKDIDHDFDSQDSWWPFRARSSRLASVAIVRQTSHSTTYIVTHDHIWRSRLSIDFVTTFKCDSSATSCLCTHRNFAGTMGTDWADVATLFSGIWYQSCYHFPRIARFRTTILKRSPVFFPTGGCSRLPSHDDYGCAVSELKKRKLTGGVKMLVSGGLLMNALGISYLVFQPQSVLVYIFIFVFLWLLPSGESSRAY